MESVEGTVGRERMAAHERCCRIGMLAAGMICVDYDKEEMK